MRSIIPLLFNPDQIGTSGVRVPVQVEASQGYAGGVARKVSIPDRAFTPRISPKRSSLAARFSFPLTRDVFLRACDRGGGGRLLSVCGRILERKPFASLPRAGTGRLPRGE